MKRQNPRIQIIKKMMHGLGNLYAFLYKLPLGEKMVRSLSGGFGKLMFYTPVAGAKKHTSIEGLEKTLMDITRLTGFNLEVIKDTKSPDSFEFYVYECPYNYNREGQSGVCDAVMDMDRELFRKAGGELVIKEYISRGADKCRLLVQLDDK